METCTACLMESIYCLCTVCLMETCTACLVETCTAGLMAACLMESVIMAVLIYHYIIIHAHACRSAKLQPPRRFWKICSALSPAPSRCCAAKSASAPAIAVICIGRGGSGETHLLHRPRTSATCKTLLLVPSRVPVTGTGFLYIQSVRK